MTRRQNTIPVAEAITVLVVDDDEVDVMGIERAFRHAGLHNTIAVATDGLTGLAMLRDGVSVPRPYLILLDINMPRMNGLEFLDALRRDDRLHDSLVFILSTSKAKEDKHRAYQHNIAGYMVKERANEGFLSAVNLLDQYQKRIEFP